MFKRFILAAAIAAATFSVAAKSVPYRIDPNHTQVEFSWNHFGFSHITGRFDKVEGTFLFDPADPTQSSVEVTIPISSIDTGVDDLDEHLRSADFFDEEKFPTATFKSTKVERVDEDQLKVNGDLTIHGVTKPVVLDVTINRVGDHPIAKRAAAGFDAKLTIKRSDFGVAKFVPNVSDEIAIEITTETMVPKPESKQPEGTQPADKK
ncbi:YceI family protein [Lysobacter sp. CFH 32150]|uniref:YceI family protein n=1 Tax=Lysobacter sp. CFH 32150 TaxID=2927128 RepID=UPI001FA7ECE1|nr:YceI family protein [Lysobacter sp. CFH 32150]MCI4568306.1 YceI family protein [Lysobacter sp. CFH 32150]